MSSSNVIKIHSAVDLSEAFGFAQRLSDKTNRTEASVGIKIMYKLEGRFVCSDNIVNVSKVKENIKSNILLVHNTYYNSQTIFK